MSWYKVLTDNVQISDLYDEQTKTAALVAARKKGLAESAMSKEAGLFMRPSEIGSHENLASALESKLNGASPEPQFKKAGLSTNQAVGGAIGAVGGYGAHRRAVNRNLEEFKPEDVKGGAVSKKVGKAIHAVKKKQTEFAKINPKASIAVHSIAGASAGAAVGSAPMSTVSRLIRRR